LPDEEEEGEEDADATAATAACERTAALSLSSLLCLRGEEDVTVDFLASLLSSFLDGSFFIIFVFVWTPRLSSTTGADVLVADALNESILTTLPTLLFNDDDDFSSEAAADAAAVAETVRSTATTATADNEIDDDNDDDFGGTGTPISDNLRLLRNETDASGGSVAKPNTSDLRLVILLFFPFLLSLRPALFHFLL
jgi:hypothetical protein